MREYNAGDTNGAVTDLVHIGGIKCINLLLPIYDQSQNFYYYFLFITAFHI